MKTQKVISYKNLPTGIPWMQTGMIYLLLDKFNVSDFVSGIFVTFIIFLWLVYFYQKLAVEIPTEIWK